MLISLDGARLTLYLDGEECDTIAVPAKLQTASRECALGGNPRHTGPEFLAAEFRDFELRTRALSAAEIATLAEKPGVNSP